MLNIEQTERGWEAFDTAEEEEPDELEAASGERARIARRAGRETLEVVAVDGELIFSYDPISRVTRLAIPEGDLRLATPQGDITLEAGGEVKIAGRKKLELESEHLRIAGTRGELELDTVTYAGRRLRATLADAKFALGKLRTVASTIHQRAGHLYRTIDGLAQTRAGKLRTQVTGSFHLSGEDLNLKARRDAKIDGEQILLG